MSIIPPSLTVVVVNWNGRRWLPRLFDTLLPQLTPYDAEVILVDNGSSDDSVPFVHAHYPRVQVVIGDNRGYAAGVNVGLAQARGEYILVLNTDLAFPPSAVAAMLTAMQSQPGLGLATPVLLTDQGTINTTYGVEPDERAMLTIMLGLQKRLPALARELVAPAREEGPSVEAVPWPMGACLVVRKAALDQVGPMDEHFFMYFEDADWGRRFRQAGWQVALLRQARVIHSYHGSSSTQAVMQPARWYYGSLDYYARKHYGRRRAWLLRTINVLTYIKATVTLWVRSQLPSAAPGAIVMNGDTHHKLIYYRSLLQLFRAQRRFNSHDDASSRRVARAMPAPSRAPGRATGAGKRRGHPGSQSSRRSSAG